VNQGILAVILLFSTAQICCAQGLSELKDRYWEIVSIDADIPEMANDSYKYYAKCDDFVFQEEGYILNNYNKVGSDALTIILDGASCSRNYSPTPFSHSFSFNAVSIEIDKASPDDIVIVSLGLFKGDLKGYNNIGELPDQRPEESGLRHRNKLIRLKMQCSLEYTGFFSLDYAYVNCRNERLNSSIRLIAH